MQDTDWIFKTSESSSTKAVFEATIENTKSKKYSFHLKNKMNVSIKNIVVPIAPTGISSTSKNFYGYSGTTQNPSSSTKINPSYSGMNVTLTSDSESNKYMRLILPATLGDDFVGYQGYGKNTKIEWSLKNSTNGFSIGDNSIYNIKQLSDDNEQKTTLIAKITKDKYTQNFELGITFQLNEHSKPIPKIDDIKNNLFSTINVNDSYELEVHGNDLPIEINSYIFSENDQTKTSGWSIKNGSTSSKIIFLNSNYKNIKGKNFTVSLVNSKSTNSPLFTFSVPNIEIPTSINNTSNYFTAKEGIDSNNINTNLASDKIIVDSWKISAITSNFDNKYIELSLPSTSNSWLNWNNNSITHNKNIFWTLDSSSNFELSADNLISVNSQKVTTTYKLKNKRPLNDKEISVKLHGKLTVSSIVTKNSNSSNDNVALIFDLDVVFKGTKDDGKSVINKIDQNLFLLKLNEKQDYTDILELKIKGRNLPINNDDKQWNFELISNSNLVSNTSESVLNNNSYWKIDSGNSSSSSVVFVANYNEVYGKKFKLTLNNEQVISKEFSVTTPTVSRAEGVVGYISESKVDSNDILPYYYAEKPVVVIYGQNLPLSSSAYSFKLNKKSNKNEKNKRDLSKEDENKNIWDEIWKFDLDVSSRNRVVFSLNMLSAREQGYNKNNNDRFEVHVKGLKEESKKDFWFDRHIIFSSKESLANIEYYFSVIESIDSEKIESINVNGNKNSSIISGGYDSSKIITIVDDDLKVSIEPKIDDIVIGIDSTIVTTKNIKKNKISEY